MSEESKGSFLSRINKTEGDKVIADSDALRTLISNLQNPTDSPQVTGTFIDGLTMIKDAI